MLYANSESNREPERARGSQREQESKPERARESQSETERAIESQSEPDSEPERARVSRTVNETQSGEWHFFPTDETRFCLTEASKTVKRLQSEKSRLSFMDK